MSVRPRSRNTPRFYRADLRSPDVAASLHRERRAIGAPQTMEPKFPLRSPGRLRVAGQAFSQESADEQSHPLTCLPAGSHVGLIADASGRLRRARAGPKRHLSTPTGHRDAAAERFAFGAAFTDAAKFSHTCSGPAARTGADAAIDASRAGAAAGHHGAARNPRCRAHRAAPAAHAAAKASRAQSPAAGGAKYGTGPGRGQSSGRLADPDLRSAA